ncbi:hypothetical protein ACROYT_G011891 [Oculina patagonica]
MNKTEESLPSCSFLDLNLEQTKDTFIAGITTCILNTVFSMLTASGNFIILHVIWKKQELHSPSFVLLSCLAASDLLVGLICQPFYVAYKIAELEDNFSAYCVLRMIYSITGWTTSGVSLFILSGVSIDRLLALTLHLRYNMVVTVRRVFQTAVCLWVFATAGVISQFWMNKWIILPVVTFALTFLVITVSTLKIFQIVRRHQRQISQQQQSVQFNVVNVIKCRKSAVTVVYVYGLFVIFYLPFWTTMFVETFFGFTLTVKIAYEYATTVVFINSFLNPLVYCWRIGEVRRAVKNTLRNSLLYS